MNDTVQNHFMKLKQKQRVNFSLQKYRFVLFYIKHHMKNNLSGIEDHSANVQLICQRLIEECNVEHWCCATWKSILCKYFMLTFQIKVASSDLKKNKWEKDATKRSPFYVSFLCIKDHMTIFFTSSYVPKMPFERK